MKNMIKLTGKDVAAAREAFLNNRTAANLERFIEMFKRVYGHYPVMVPKD